MRTLTDHLVEGDDAPQVIVAVLDEPGQGGACHLYSIQLPNRTTFAIHFQNGPIKEYGPNGVTDAALLAILLDRLRGFQAGPYACPANHMALTDGCSMLEWLQQRTRERLARGVEGTNAK